MIEPDATVDLEVEGLEVGHWTHREARTGCTVVVLPPGSVVSGEIRGGAPASREFALLDPTRTVGAVDAVVLSGGSAFGLAACDGVMGELEAAGRGYETVAGVVPIVVGISLFDLAVGDASVRPDADSGRAAFRARGPTTPIGPVGAGAGATTGKWTGPDRIEPGGFGAAVVRRGDLVVVALIALNSFGSVDDGGPGPVDELLAGTFVWPEEHHGFALGARTEGHNTTIGVLVTNGSLDKVECHLVAQTGHDGLARAVVPAHTRSDGDALVVGATGTVETSVDDVRLLSLAAVVGAARSAVGTLDR